MNCRAIIKDKIYYFPSSIYMLNEQLFEDYSYKKTDESIIDLNEFKKKVEYKDLDLISFQCAACVGESTLDDPNRLDRYNKIGPNLRELDYKSKYHVSREELDAAREDQLKMIELVIGFYTDEINLEKEKSNSKSSR